MQNTSPNLPSSNDDNREVLSSGSNQTISSQDQQDVRPAVEEEEEDRDEKDVAVKEEVKESKRKSSNGSNGFVNCKICFDSTKDEETVTPCLCKGSIGKVHLSCLERWLGMTNAHSCELCGYRFSTIRRPMYKICYSVFYWLFREDELMYRRGIGLDTALFLILSPIIWTGMYCCVVISSYYQKPLGDVPGRGGAGNWTSIALMIMACVMALGYYLWTSLVLRSHGRAWYRWWQARNHVHVLNVPHPQEQIRHQVITLETSFV